MCSWHRAVVVPLSPDASAAFQHLQVERFLGLGELPRCPYADARLFTSVRASRGRGQAAGDFHHPDQDRFGLGELPLAHVLTRPAVHGAERHGVLFPEGRWSGFPSAFPTAAARWCYHPGFDMRSRWYAGSLPRSAAAERTCRRFGQPHAPALPPPSPSCCGRSSVPPWSRRSSRRKSLTALSAASSFALASASVSRRLFSGLPRVSVIAHTSPMDSKTTSPG